MKASSCPSADHELGIWLPSPPLVNRSNPPLLSANCQKILSGAPSLLDPNAIRLPSGVQTGSSLFPPSNVSRVSVFRARS